MAAKDPLRFFNPKQINTQDNLHLKANKLLALALIIIIMTLLKVRVTWPWYA